VWPPFLVSRAVVWVVGILTSWLRVHQARPFDPTGLTASLGHVGNILAAPAVRWDAVWYLSLGQHGYQGTSLADFFPLYPLLIRIFSWSTASAIVAGVLISLVAFWVALEVVYRLVEMDFGPRPAMATVWLLALFPVSLFYSAVYTESLFLALSAGCIYAARRDRWVWAGILGGLASATRSMGLLLLVPLAVLYVQQLRRAGDPPARPFAHSAPRWRGLLGIALVPLGLVAYIVEMAIEHGMPLAMFNSQEAGRGFVLPPVTIVRQFSWTVNHFGSLTSTGHYEWGLLFSGIPELCFLTLACVCAAGMIRRLHPAYVAYAIAALLVLLSEPTIHGGQPLTSFPRYIMVVFPLWMWLALVLHRRRRIWIGVLAVSTLALGLFAAQFATWYFVA
jgi:hypothetical protein